VVKTLQDMPETHGGEKREPTAARPKSRRVIARRLAVSFGLVSIVTVAMYGMLLILIGEVSGLVKGMRVDETAIRESLNLATAVREQYMHQAHWLIERDDEHLDHYARWLERVEHGIRVLRPLGPEGERHQLDEIAADSRALDEVFRSTIRPAALDGNWEAVAEGHQTAQLISQRAAAQADEIATVVEGKMAGAHISAIRATRFGLIAGALCVLLALSLSIAFTVRLRRAVIQPLELLSKAARRFGSGDFYTRVGEVGEGEFRALSETFDHMAGELEERQRRLVESERMAAIGQLAAGVAHEINNPVGIIRGYLKTMGPDSPPDTLREELQILDDEAAACQRIAEDLVAYARAPELRCDSIAMDTLLRETARRFEETSEGAKLRVVLDIAPGEAYADSGRLRQVVLNLMMNAAQASEPDGLIEVSGAPAESGAYEILVSDHGAGISPEDRAKVFEPFFTKRPGGSGLGLAVCQGILRAHGGSVMVEDREGGGTTFRVKIPGAAAVRKERV
jgi:two-component system NtrC family sensor kinase